MTAGHPDDDLFWLDAVAQRMHRGPWWLSAGIVALFLVLPFAIAFVQGTLTSLLPSGPWRIALLAPVNFFYTVLVSPVLTRQQPQIAANIRPLSDLGDEEYDALVERATARQPRAEWIAFGIGVLAQVALFGLPSDPNPFDLYSFVTFSIMYGAMGWIVYKAVASTRLSRALSRVPLDVNIFDITPFQPIGRHSLNLSMVFVGGIIVSMIFVFSWDAFLQREDIVIYAVVLLITVLVFFLGMWPTHRLLSNERKSEVQNATRTLSGTYEVLRAEQVRNEDTTATESKIDAWIALERRLKVTRTWPYDTEMLRTLVITIVTPIAVGLSKIAGVILTNPRP